MQKASKTLKKFFLDVKEPRKLKNIFFRYRNLSNSIIL